jgi:glycosyltransferase involved in cell wall biosynthesis
MNRLRVLLLGPDCDPERVSIPFVTYCHAAALAELHDVTLVAKSIVEPALRRAKAPFRHIEVIHTPRLDRIFAWSFRRIFKSNYDSQVVTAFKYPFSIAFEWFAWKQLRRRIHSGEFEVVLRLVPMSPALPSPFAFFLRNGPIPFVIGPLNGGLPWPPGFGQLKVQREWIAGLRNFYRYLPFARSTYKHAAAIIAASSQTFSEFGEYSNKLFFVPEPGIGVSVCSEETRESSPDAKLKLIFVGGLVPRKACDLALRGAADLLRNRLAHFNVIGDGPERSRLEQLAESLGIKDSVSFCGWLNHREVLKELQNADVMVFPSIRDNGAGVVFEALASGAVPIVVDFGGPGDIVHSEVGYKIPLTNESDMVAQIAKSLEKLAGDRDLLLRLRTQGIRYARESLTWDAKARSTSRVLNWVVKKGIKPDLLPPKMLEMETSR